MQFRNFIWPNEPSSLRVTSRRRTALLEEPGGGWTLQDLGTAARTVTGEGVFFGDSAKANLYSLLSLFRKGGIGMVRHPQWGNINVYPQELDYWLEPEENCIHYRFSFLEAPI